MDLNDDPLPPQNVALFAMAFYFDSASVAVMAAAAVGYFAPVYLLSQGILGPSIVQLAAVRYCDYKNWKSWSDIFLVFPVARPPGVVHEQGDADRGDRADGPRRPGEPHALARLRRHLGRPLLHRPRRDRRHGTY